MLKYVKTTRTDEGLCLAMTWDCIIVNIVKTASGLAAISNKMLFLKQSLLSPLICFAFNLKSYIYMRRFVL